MIQLGVKPLAANQSALFARVSKLGSLCRSVALARGRTVEQTQGRRCGLLRHWARGGASRAPGACWHLIGTSS